MAEKVKSMGTCLAIGAIKATSFLYDVATLPIYTLVQRPWIAWRDTFQIAARHIEPGNPSSPVINTIKYKSNQLAEIETIPELFTMIVQKYSNIRCMGTREILDEEEEMQPDGKVFKKVILGDYHWITYREVSVHVSILSKSLLNLGVRPRETVTLLAETRAEWMLLAVACFHINVPLVTLFPTLGEDGIVHGICESGSPFLFTSADLLPKVKKILDQIRLLSYVIYFEGFRKPDLTSIPENVKILSYREFYHLGEMSQEEFPVEHPTKDDTALIMYTSGTTGIPKGVIFAHKQIMFTISGIIANVIDHKLPVNSDDVYLAYLPLAHIFELSLEFFALFVGASIGYSSPFTLSDKSTAIKKGDKGDLAVLKPTVLIAVPVVLDRIKKGILEAVEAKGVFTKALFNFALKYKSRWYRLGYKTPLVDRLVFHKIKQQAAGALKIIPTGGAALSTDTWDFVRLCLDVFVIMAYGQSETTGLGTITIGVDRSMDHVGPPAKDVLIRLLDWPQGGYSVLDRPNPRGEIAIGGGSVAEGYYKNEKLTREVFFEANGLRWARTGDIGEFLPNGKLRVIDRKMDLVKLQDGEYVSLGRIETELKTCPLVDNLCVVNNKYEIYLVALVVPNKEQLVKMAQRQELSPRKLTFAELCRNPEICKGVFQTLVDHGKKCRLTTKEIPKKVMLCPEEWIPDSGLVSPAMKVRRKVIEEFYRDAIDEMYRRGPNKALDVNNNHNIGTCS